MVYQTPILRANKPSALYFKNGAYKSPYGPKYNFQPNVAGWTMKELSGLGFKAGAFGGVALVTVLFFASGIPRVQKDILQKIPVIGDNFIHEIPASDNPF
ncbi:ubiquinol-cytochrome-c reductase complex subunit-domain-containing protein [Xylaria sp. CBS 124048]|nr:ubiquinol-cytochrome-c reductase complex subunit-domain-containing protein [Xylaria sp. CBS 124048]